MYLGFITVWVGSFWELLFLRSTCDLKDSASSKIMFEWNIARRHVGLTWRPCYWHVGLTTVLLTRQAEDRAILTCWGWWPFYWHVGAGDRATDMLGLLGLLAVLLTCWGWWPCYWHSGAIGGATDMFGLLAVLLTCWGYWPCSWRVGAGSHATNVLGLVAVLLTCWGWWPCYWRVGAGGRAKGELLPGMGNCYNIMLDLQGGHARIKIIINQSYDRFLGKHK